MTDDIHSAYFLFTIFYFLLAFSFALITFNFCSIATWKLSDYVSLTPKKTSYLYTWCSDVFKNYLWFTVWVNYPIWWIEPSKQILQADMLQIFVLF